MVADTEATLVLVISMGYLTTATDTFTIPIVTAVSGHPTCSTNLISERSTSSIADSLVATRDGLDCR